MSATLTVTHTEQIKLNGSQQGASTTQTINSITEVYKRSIAIPTSEVTLLSFGAAVSAGTFVESDV